MRWPWQKAHIEAQPIAREKALTIPWLSDMLREDGMGAGESVTASTAQRSAAVYAAVRVVSEDVAKLPVRVVRVASDGSRVAIEHPLVGLLNRNPNLYQTGFEFKEYLQVCVETAGNAFCWIERDGRNNIVALHPINPRRVQTLVVTETGEAVYQVTNDSQSRPVPKIYLPRYDVLHVKGQSDNIYTGKSPIHWARDSIGITLAADRYAGSFFSNSAKPDVIMTPKAKLSPEAVISIRDAFERRHKGSSNAGRPAVMPVDMDIKQLTISNKDSQFLEIRQYQVSEIARIFRLPPHKIADLSRATFSNIEHQALEYYSDGLMPRLERFESALNQALLAPSEQAQLEIEFDVDRILRADTKSRFEGYSQALSSGWLSINEVRAREGLPPIEGGDTHRAPLNMEPVNGQTPSNDQPEAV